MLSFVLNLSPILCLHEAEPQFLLASWPRQASFMLIDICFCGKRLLLTLLQCISSPVSQPRLVKPAMFPIFRKPLSLSVKKSWLSLETSDFDVCFNLFHFPLYFLQLLLQTFFKKDFEVKLVLCSFFRRVFSNILLLHCFTLSTSSLLSLPFPAVLSSISGAKTCCLCAEPLRS